MKDMYRDHTFNGFHQRTPVWQIGEITMVQAARHLASGVLLLWTAFTSTQALAQYTISDAKCVMSNSNQPYTGLTTPIGILCFEPPANPTRVILSSDKSVSLHEVLMNLGNTISAQKAEIERGRQDVIALRAELLTAKEDLRRNFASLLVEAIGKLDGLPEAIAANPKSVKIISAVVAATLKSDPEFRESAPK